ncbi:recombinase family protein [Curtobacterium sp. TC1]|nr:recombinase family protein [Curtobacterium sp. TC1]
MYDPLAPMERMIFGMLSVFTEFDANLVSAHTTEGMATARTKNRLKAGSPSSPTSAKRSWCRCTDPATTRPASSQNCSTSPAPPCTERSLEAKQRI